MSMAQFHYDGDMVGGSLMVRESRVIAGLLLAGTTPEQWDQAIRVDNLLQKRSPASAKRNAQAIRKRLELLAPAFWRVLRDGDDELATQAAFCAVLARNQMLVEFMETLLRDAYVSKTAQLATYLWTEFLEDCAHRDTAIHDWTPSTQKKTGQVAYRILAEVGYLNNTRERKLQKVLVRPEINMMLEEHAKYRIKACMEIST